jgi:hypothetical protein
LIAHTTLVFKVFAETSDCQQKDASSLLEKRRGRGVIAQPLLAGYIQGPTAKVVCTVPILLVTTN